MAPAADPIEIDTPTYFRLKEKFYPGSERGKCYGLSLTGNIMLFKHKLLSYVEESVTKDLSYTVYYSEDNKMEILDPKMSNLDYLTLTADLQAQGYEFFVVRIF